MKIKTQWRDVFGRGSLDEVCVKCHFIKDKNPFLIEEISFQIYAYSNGNIGWFISHAYQNEFTIRSIDATEFLHSKKSNKIYYRDIIINDRFNFSRGMENYPNWKLLNMEK